MLAPLVAEAVRYASTVKAYRLDFLVEMVSFSLLFVGLEAAGDPRGFSASLLGYMMWYLGFTALTEIGSGVDDESMGGTLEQLALTRIGLLPALVGRSVVVVITEVASASLLGLLSLAFAKLLLRPVPSGPILAQTVVATVVLVVIGMLGMGLEIGALVLAKKRSSSAIPLLQYLMLFFTGVFTGIEGFPTALKVVAYAFPLSWAGQALRQPDHGIWIWGLLACVFIHLTSGVLLFSRIEMRARRKGQLYEQ